MGLVKQGKLYSYNKDYPSGTTYVGMEVFDNLSTNKWSEESTAWESSSLSYPADDVNIIKLHARRLYNWELLGE